MGTDLNIAIAGATGALGKELVSMLDGAPWRPEGLMPAARAATTTDFVEYGDQQIAVDDVATLDLEAIDGLIVATPRECVADLIDRAVEAGVPVVDCTGSQLANLEVPLVIPWVNGAVLDAERTRDVAAVPTPAALMLTSLLAPLSRAGWSGTASATLMMPASWWGHHGVEELSQQVIALFNHGTPARRVFDQGLAFDLLPAVGDIGATSWTSAEVHSVAEVARLTGVRCDLSLVGVPVFSGMSATVRIETDDLDPETAVRHLADAGIQLVGDDKPRKLPRPRRVEGEPWLYAARVRRGLDGHSLHLWLSMDNLRVSASAAVGTLARLLRTDSGDMLSEGSGPSAEG